MPWQKESRRVVRVEQGRVLGVPGKEWFFLCVSVPWGQRSGYRRHLNYGTTFKVPQAVTRKLTRAELELLKLIRAYVENNPTRPGGWEEFTCAGDTLRGEEENAHAKAVEMSDWCMKNFGFTRLSRSFSSSWLACP